MKNTIQIQFNKSLNYEAFEAVVNYQGLVICAPLEQRGMNAVLEMIIRAFGVNHPASNAEYSFT